MTQKRIAYFLSCVLMAPAAVASATETSANPANPVPFLPAETTAPQGHGEFERALQSMDLSGDQRANIANLAADFCHDTAPSTVSRGSEIAFHDDIKGVLEPGQREELDDRVLQLKIEERVIE